MGVYDTIVLLMVLAGAFFGWRKGLATQVASIVSIVASYLVAVNFREQVAAKIDAAPPWNTFAAMLILFVGTSLVIWIIFRQVRSSIEAMKLREFDYQMGAILGGFKGFILASLVTLFAITLLYEDQRQVILHSKSGALIARFLNGATPIMPQEVRNFLGPYIDRLDQELGIYPGSLQAGSATGGAYPATNPYLPLPTNPESARAGNDSYATPQPLPPMTGYRYPPGPRYEPVRPPSPLTPAPGATPWNSGTGVNDWRATSPPAGSRF